MRIFNLVGGSTLLSLALAPAAHSQTSQTSQPAAAQVQQTTASASTEAAADGTSTLALPDIIIREKAQERGYQPKRASTATRSDAALLETPQSVGVVPAQVIQDQLIRNIDEAMYNISGVTQANTLGGTQDALIKRGFGFNRDGSILRDGIRTVLARNLTYTTERVEVLKGPSSIMYGTMDPGGVVNMVTKKPQLTTQGQVALTASDLGGGASVDLTGAIGTSGLAYRLIADYSNSNYWRNFGDSRQLVIAPSLAWYGRDNTVRMSYEHTNYEQPFDRGTVIDSRTGKPVNIPRDERLDEAYNRSIGDSDFFTVQSQHKLDQQWTANFAYSYNRNRYDDFQARTVSLNPVTGVLTRRPDGTRGALSQQHAVQSDITGKLKLGEMRNDVMLGFDFEDSNIYRRDLIRGVNDTRFNIYHPVYGLLPNSTNISAPDSDQADKLHAWSLFAQDTIHFNEQWIAQAGLRYQQYDEVAGKGRPFNINTNVSGNKLIPRVGLVYLVSPSVSLYTSYSESFKPNTSIATHIDALPPEQGKSWEVGAKLDMTRGITATAALYNIDKENVQVSQVINGDTFVRAAGKARSRGVELDVAGEIARQWKLIGNYAYTDAKVTQDPILQDKQLANVAKQSAAIFLTHDFDRSANRDQWRAGAGVRYVGKRAGDSANSFFLDPYHVVDAFASYDTTLGGHAAHLQFNIKNLLDKTYYPSAGSNIYVAVGDARQFILRGIVDF